MFTQEDLATKTGPQLVSLFNGIEGTKPIKRFTNREVGIRRILAVTAGMEVEFSEIRPVGENLVKLESQVAATLEEIVNAPFKDAKPKKERGVYNIPRKPLIRTFRKNSRRGRLITRLLTTGATFDELLVDTEIGFPVELTLHKTLRILNWWTGYGLTTDENGIIRLVG
jgi:hypothetical protein